MNFSWLPPDAQATPCAPPLTSKSGERSPAALASVVEQFQVTKAPRYQPGRGLTWCNRFAKDVLAALGVAVPDMVRGEWTKANWLYDWFAGEEAREQGWRAVNRQEAAQRANAGFPVVVVSRGTGNGHIAVGVPNTSANPGLLVTQAGGRNFERGPVGLGFGTISTKQFTHD